VIVDVRGHNVFSQRLQAIVMNTFLFGEPTKSRRVTMVVPRRQMPISLIVDGIRFLQFILFSHFNSLERFGASRSAIWFFSDARLQSGRQLSLCVR
jgi:hypothetical protein